MPHTRITTLGILLLAAGSGLAVRHSIPAPFVSDEDLATRPIIVVAKWKEAPFKSNHKVEGNVLQEWEVQTEVEIERVIKGDLKPGKHKIQVGFRIGWQLEGGPVVSYMSTEQIGDVEEVCVSNLWFLSKKKSWDPTDKTEYFYLDTFRGVQPLVLEKYFDALRSKEPQVEVPKLADSNEPLIVTRVLEYISGGRLPWPFEPWEFVRPKEKRKPPLKAESQRVVKLLDPRKETEIRGLALAVYADLAGKDALAKIRELVSDKEVLVRSIAAGLAAEHRDAESVDALCKAAAAIAPAARGEHKLKEAHIACDFIRRCADWGDPKLVPAVIPFLQNDTFVYQYGDDLGVPALKAREALKKMTGHDFPLDTAASRKAWDQVLDIDNPDERRKRLATLLAATSTPLTARIVNPDGKPAFVVTNGSSAPTLIAKRPWSICLDYSGGTGSFGGFEIKGKEDFQELKPGASITIPFPKDSDFVTSFLAADPASRRALLRFLRNGGEFGLNAWIGNLEAKLDEGWKEPDRDVKVEEEKWPNGTLKAKGPTLNGKRHGTWHFYREDGKRIREVEYFNGNVSKVAELNPNYVPPEERKN